MCSMFKTCHFHFWQNDQVLLCNTVTVGNTGVERIPKSESAQKRDLGKEYSPAAPAGNGIRDLQNGTKTLISVAVRNQYN